MTATSAERVAAACRLVPGLTDHAVIPGSAPLAGDFDAAWRLLTDAVSLDPTCAAAHAARANLLLRRGKSEDARKSYALAARLDPYDAPSRLALGELAFMAANAAEAQRWFDAAFALTRVYSPVPRRGARSALVLCVAGPWHRNIPLDFIVDPERWTLHRWYLPDASADVRLPAYDLVIDAIGESMEARPALAAAEAFIAGQARPSLNAPARVRVTARDELAAAVRDAPGCTVAPARRVSPDGLARIADGFPLLVRPADAHGGRGLERIAGAAALATYAAAHPAPHYDVAKFVDYRGAGGYFRKYRVMFVDGVPYPYHLAIDRSWMIHYRTAPMDEHAWMREEERRFLAAPEEAFVGWDTTLGALASAIGLDYFGIDCTLLEDGTLFIFEADSAMLVHRFTSDAEKLAAVDRIRSAFDALLRRRAGEAQPFSSHLLHSDSHGT